MLLADIESITPAGLWVGFAGILALVVFTVFVIVLHVNGLLDLWREEQEIRRIERELGRR